MIESIEFDNFRNLSGTYEIPDLGLSVFFGKNSEGKTNILDGISLAFSALTGDYFKINKSDFYNSDDSKAFSIKVKLKEGSIPDLMYFDSDGNEHYDFVVKVRRLANGRYIKELRMGNEQVPDWDALNSSDSISRVHRIPLVRIEDIYSDGLVSSISDILESEDDYKKIRSEAKEKVKAQIKDKCAEFETFCSAFNQKLRIEVDDPRIQNEKIFITDGTEEHNKMIGSGYKSIANIFLNTLGVGQHIVLIDEIENHLHPAMLRLLLGRLEVLDSVQIVATTHSPVVLNQVGLDKVIGVAQKQKFNINQENKQKLDVFLGAEKAELLMADNLIIVEGYSEKLLLMDYARRKGFNWTILNAEGVMFEPYLELAKARGVKVIAISDNDCSTTDDGKPTPRFRKLKRYCEDMGIKLIEVENTLESDLYKNGFINEAIVSGYLCAKAETGYMVSKEHRSKVDLAVKLLDSSISLDDWHVIREIEDEFSDN